MNLESGPSASRKRYRKDIDGIRALAVLAVVLFHAGVASLRGGFVGVDIFFVISGYLIGAHVYEEISEGRFSLARFYQRRAKRILPALLVLLLACYALGFALLSPLELKHFGTYAMTSLFSVSNLYAWLRSGYFDAAANQNPLLMTWTLAVEEQFYIVFPLLMMAIAVLARTRSFTAVALRRFVFRTIASLAVASAVACILATPILPTATFYLIPYRAWELAAGVLLAVYEARPEARPQQRPDRRRWLQEAMSVSGLAATLGSIFGYTADTRFPGPGALLPVAGALLLLAAPEAWLNRRVLSLAPLRWIGLVSYSWYLWHWPLLSFASIVSLKPLKIQTALLLCLLALAFAALSYYFVEQPMRRSHTAPAPLLRRYAVACVLMALLAAGMVVTHGAARRFPALATEEQTAVMKSLDCFAQTTLIASQTCMPATDGRDAVVLLGDSHAAALSPQIEQLAQEQNLRLITLVRFTCAPTLGVVPRSPQTAIESGCEHFTADAVTRAATDPTVRTVILSGRWAEPLELGSPQSFGYAVAGRRGPVTQQQSDENFEQGLARTVDTLKSAGKRVLLVEDVVTFQLDPERLLRNRWIPARSRVARWLRTPQFNANYLPPNEFDAIQNSHMNAIVAHAAQTHGAELFDAQRALRNGDEALFFYRGHLLYEDTNHLSSTGATLALTGFPSLR